MEVSQTLAQLTLFAEASRSHAKTSLTRDARLDSLRGQEADSIRKSSAFLANYDHDSSSWKTSQHCLVALANGQAGGLAEFSGTWPRSGMTRNGTAYELEPVDCHKSVTVSGSWPTPTKSDAKRLSLKLSSLTKRVRFVNGNKWNFAEHAAEMLDGYPSPELAEWVMGYPRNWTLPELEPAEIQSSLRSPNSSAKPSSKRKGEDDAK